MDQPQHPALFWLYYLLFNFLLFIPGFLFEVMHTNFIPVNIFNFSDFPHNLWLLLYREHADIFRINGDFYVMVLLFILLVKKHPPSPWLVKGSFGLYLLLFAYSTYQGFSFGIYREEPHLSGDLTLLPETFNLLAFETTWQRALIYGLYTIIGAGLLYGFYHLWRQMFRLTSLLRPKNIHRSVYLTLGMVVLLITGSNYYSNINHDNYYNTVRWSFFQLHKNIQRVGQQHQNIASITRENLRENYGYSTDSLHEKPDILLFFPESYGKLMATSPEFRDAYQQLMVQLQDTLRQYGWHSITNYSQAPISGGRSWLSFTTVTNGLALHNHAQYSHLLHQMPDYPHMLRKFQQWGYTNYKINPLHHSGKDIPVTFYKNYYAIDRWIQHDDFNYRGPSYGWAGIPDQYTLHYFHDHYLAATDHPSLVFFLTLTGHTPWKDIPPLKNDWKEFNKDNRPSNSRGRRRILQLPAKDHYREAMEYQLKVFANYIQQKAKDNSIILLIGDHQPPGITPPGSSFETPIHIISSNKKFLQAFKEYGFKKGLWVSPFKDEVINHAGFYSMFMREFLKCYGKGDFTLPGHLPEGIKVE